MLFPLLPTANLWGLHRQFGKKLHKREKMGETAVEENKSNRNNQQKEKIIRKYRKSLVVGHSTDCREGTWKHVCVKHE